MTDLILILSKCEKRIRKVKERQNYYRFHFKGYYLGEKIEEVLIRDENSIIFDLDSDYLLLVKKLSLENGILRVTPIKYKKMST